MEIEQYFLLGTCGIGLFCLIASFITRKTAIFMNFILNIAGGVVAIYLINSIMKWQGMESGVGINGVTVFVGALLGLSGIIMSYGVSFLGGI